jgi:hypothetical protein
MKSKFKSSSLSAQRSTEVTEREMIIRDTAIGATKPMRFSLSALSASSVPSVRSF